MSNTDMNKHHYCNQLCVTFIFKYSQQNLVIKLRGKMTAICLPEYNGQCNHIKLGVISVTAKLLSEFFVSSSFWKCQPISYMMMHHKHKRVGMMDVYSWCLYLLFISFGKLSVQEFSIPTVAPTHALDLVWTCYNNFLGIEIL